jgi:hypothetical protein
VRTAPDLPDPGLIRAYADLPPFRSRPDVLLLGNPYSRPIGAETLAEVDWTQPVSSADALGRDALAAHRLLVNVYETESVILPKDGLSTAGDFDAFYGPEQRRLRDLVRPGLERYAYGFLDSAVEVSGHWTLDALVAHFTECVTEAGAAENVAMRTIEAARNPRDAAATYLIQLALDGLTEASAMARNLPGAYGPEQLELFKIFIDEFGYGVYQSKHSTIFEKLLRSCGLHTDIHAYWHFYLTGSLALINYFNYLTEDHTKFFRYCGAVTYMEWIFAQGFAEAGETLAKVYGPDVDTHYTDEHAHIDQHHGKMARAAAGPYRAAGQPDRLARPRARVRGARRRAGGGMIVRIWTTGVDPARRDELPTSPAPRRCRRSGATTGCSASSSPAPAPPG